MTIYDPQLEIETDEYKAFVEKFKPKKTKDDCLTPPPVYEAVKDWVVEEYGLEGREIVRPFWSGAVDYRRQDYPEGCVVIDNPPFSIYSEILRFYTAYEQDFFLFAPHLTLFNARGNFVLCGANVVYENGAKVNTSFATSLGEYKIMTAPTLYKRIADVQKLQKKSPPNFAFPHGVLKSTSLDTAIKYGIELKIKPSECFFRRNLDYMKAKRGGVFGGCFLLSPAQARAHAQARAQKIPLSQEERMIIYSLEGAGELSLPGRRKD